MTINFDSSKSILSLIKESDSYNETITIVKYHYENNEYFVITIEARVLNETKITDTTCEGINITLDINCMKSFIKRYKKYAKKYQQETATLDDYTFKVITLKDIAALFNVVDAELIG